MDFSPIGHFETREQYPQEVARQGVLNNDNQGSVVLQEGCGYEGAIQDLATFSHIWLIYCFHHNAHWKPLVQPPRGRRKVGVFASRAPYRPNPIGLSCVRLLGVRGLRLEVAAHDLLDGTPILDIKPYIKYADCLPEATDGWLESIEESPWQVCFSAKATTHLAWLKERNAPCLKDFLEQQLAWEPLDQKRKRVRFIDANLGEIACRTWRARFDVDAAEQVIRVEGLYSGYSEEDLAASADPYEDKATHRAFRKAFPDTAEG